MGTLSLRRRRLPRLGATDRAVLADAAQRRIRRPLAGRQRAAEPALAAALAVVAGALALGAEVDAAPGGLALALTLALAVLARVELPAGTGWAVPTQVVFVPLLFVADVGLVVPLVVVAMVASRLPDVVRGDWHPQRLVLAVNDAWFAVGPAIVLLAAGIDGVAWSDWPWWLAALAAQLGGDLAISSLRQWVATNVRVEVHLAELRDIWLVDVSLAPVGLLAAAAAGSRPVAALLAIPLVALVAAHARERRARVDDAVRLGEAYRGTALLLCDLIEADDHYTGEHSRDVVELALAIADAMRLDPAERRRVELTALLHDVGKIVVPKEILHKPGALDPAERAIMRRHTVEGERMLEQVGGELAEVGQLVRHHHEAWSGGGYPDGLSGAAIPRPARIVAVADALSAMTTDRPYRRALDLPRARAELVRGAGTQFDPDVVAAALDALLARGHRATRSAPGGRAPAPAASAG